MTALFIACQFNYYLTTFYIKYLPGNIFVSQITVATCEISFFLVSYKLFHRLGLRRSLFMGFAFSVIGSIPLILFKDADSEATPAMLLLARVGIAYILNISYLGFSMLFPPIFAQTTFGFSKLLARIATIFAP
jgi:hypothetical protein